MKLKQHQNFVVGLDFWRPGVQAGVTILAST